MLRLNRSVIAAFVIAAGASIVRAQPEGADPERKKAEMEFTALRDRYLEKFKPLFIKSSTAWWEASTTGADEAFARRKAAENELVELHSDKATFAKIKALRDGKHIADPRLARELEVMYRTYLPGQADPELQKKIIDIQNDAEKIFNAHRGEVDGKPMTENDIRKTLKETSDSKAAEKAWKAYMQVGEKLEAKLKEVVKLRNEMAKQLGFPNFYTMQLTLQEIDEKEMLALFDELDQLTNAPFKKLKDAIDADRSKKFGVSVAQLRPWHFGDLFFQEYPGSGDEPDLDTAYKGQDLLALCKDYYKSLDMPCDDILARSDMNEKPGKSPHAFCTNIDRAQDIRVLANVKDNLYWADTVLHEVGHGVYDKYISPDVPFLLHEPAHSLTTEGMAMMFGAMVKNEDFLTRVRKLSPAEAKKVGAAARNSLRAEKLIFCRWTQVMTRFEQGMYSNPDQDLGKLWWDLKKRYQSLNPPETVGRPDYAAKVHITTSPVYYHSYMMGDLFAYQVRDFLAETVLGMSDPNKTCFYGDKKAGAFLKAKVFGPGDTWHWNELTKRATGEPLSAKAFAKQCAE